VAIVVSRVPPRPLLARAGNYLRRYTIQQICSRVVAKCYRALTGSKHVHRNAVRRWLSGATIDDVSIKPRVRVVPGHNSPQCLALLRDLRPDVIAVFGTAMIRSPVMALASKATLNMHAGLSPYYRGSDTIFWPLYNQEPEMIGVTIHLLDPGIDSGPIVATARPRIEADDDENSLVCKAIVEGTQLYIDAIRSAAAGTLRSIPQELYNGREYRFVNRTMGAERHVKQLLADGLLRRYATSQARRVLRDPATEWANPDEP